MNMAIASNHLDGSGGNLWMGVAGFKRNRRANGEGASGLVDPYSYTNYTGGSISSLIMPRFDQVSLRVSKIERQPGTVRPPAWDWTFLYFDTVGLDSLV